ncbi:prolipoprotein diacylglyceryl transferase [Antarcticimicrobium sediminis]|uniref:Phosphatidylglycerol--prolipoprotein diacylglyceryl transferase n=1 Tax=Antarcticimicrobium sediminis TaxID=2546227 RepID=A0A4R5EPH7_9RHOB|nr:prolipoprotein diacylglyceryl transferase [Antarcticimicrobium sediminis]TDE36665.1 prolipoprotein diacylglyceryl transferase [Antarcticimicrobium sediminis]
MQAVLQFPDLSPELFSFSVFGMEFALRWYALAYIAGILTAWRLAVAAVRRATLWAGATPPMTPQQIEDLLTWIILGVILGGRLGFVLFYQPAYYLQHPAEIVMVWQGGMAFHGGLLGVIVAAWAFTARHGISRIGAADLIAHTVAPGLMLGRLANFINAELWGRPTTLPWGVIFPGAAAQDCPGVVGLCARHPSQLYEAGLEGLVLGTLLLWLVYRRGALKRPGLVLGTFLSGYGLVRFVVEFARQPDAQFVTPGNPLGLALEMNGWGLTMGQLLSLPMIALGLYFIQRARRRDTQ